MDFSKINTGAFLIYLVLTISASRANTTNIKECDTLIKRAVELMWKKQHVKSLELLTQAKIQATKNKWYPQLFNATNNIGGNYYLMLDYGEAITQYLQAYNIAIAHLDETSEMIVLNNIAILYSRQKQFDKAYTYFHKAYTIARRNNNEEKKGYYAINIASVLNETGEPAKAQIFLAEALKVLAAKPEIAFLGHIVSCQSLLLAGQTSDARKHAFTLLNSKFLENDLSNKFVLYIIIAKTFIKDRNNTEALIWLHKAAGEKPDLEKKVELSSLLSEAYFVNAEYRRAVSMKDTIIAANAKLNEIRNNKLFENSNIKFQLQNYKKEIAAKDQSIKEERIFYYALLTVITFTIVILLLLYRNAKIKDRHDKDMAAQAAQVTQLKLQKEIDDNILLKKKEEIAVLEQERLNREIELQNQSISSKALYISGRDQLLQEILKALAKFPELSKSRLILKHIRALKDHLRTDRDWESFITHFEKVNHSFLKKLVERHPKLTSNDIRFISYVYMNLTNKEIATLLNISLEACRKRKERIIERLELDPDISLSSYLLSI